MLKTRKLVLCLDTFSQADLPESANRYSARLIEGDSLRELAASWGEYPDPISALENVLLVAHRAEAV